VRFFVSGDPLPLRELVPAALRAVPAPVPGRPDSAEGCEGVVVQRLVVDVHDACAQAPGDLVTTPERAGLNRGDESVLGVVAAATASSSSRTTTTGATGPKIPSRNAGMVAVTPASTVGR
jgi:hypothetical protein